MDINNIFNLFLENPSNTYVSEEAQKLADMFQEHPLVKIGMFKKLIINYYTSGDKLLEFFNLTDSELNIEDIRKAGRFIVYNRAWDYIKEIDINNEIHKEIFISVGNKELQISLNLAIRYFEEFEEYEKCSHLLVLNNLLPGNIN
jgi:hypothetical protein